MAAIFWDIKYQVMTITKKKAFSILFALLLLCVTIYSEGHGLEIQRLAVGIIGILESLFFLKILTAFDKNASDKYWTTAKSMRLKTFLSCGLILLVVTIDKLINYLLTNFNMEYKITWTVIIPVTIIVIEFFKILDIWSFENEKRDKKSGI